LKQDRTICAVPETLPIEETRLTSTNISASKTPHYSQSEQLEMKEDIGGNDRSGSPRSNESLLVRALTHRINNEFASVIGFVSVLSARSSSDEVKEVLAQVAALLHKYSGAHRALEMPTYSTVVDASCYLRALCQSIRITKLDCRDIELTLIEYLLRMHSERCWQFGMIVSELIKNSARHAFHDRGGARVRGRVRNAASKTMDRRDCPLLQATG
jgi:two-component sensor histidine kinase